MKEALKEVFFVADFECADNRKTATNDDELEAWVYLWCLTKCETMEHITGRSIDDFFKTLFSLTDEQTLLRVNFCNLKYDGLFILDWLINNGFEEKESLRSNKKYKTLIDGEGNFFHITLQFNKCRICFEDSLKKLPMGVEDMAEALNLPNKKGSIDYSAVIYPEDEIDKSIIDYCINDCAIVAEAMQKMLISNGFNALTASSNAFNHFKTLKHCDFRGRFPILSEEEDIFVRKAYKGGLCLTGDVQTYKGDVFILDKNSMYPAMMKEHPLPIGKGFYFKGKPKEDKIHPLYVARVILTAKLKENHFPCLFTKHFFSSKQTFITECYGEVMNLTNVDIETVFENYDVEQLDFIDGYRYSKCNCVFNSYIDYWYNLKKQAKEEENMFNYLLAKIFLTSLYGRFGMRLIMGKQRLELNDDGILKGTTTTKRSDGIYIPLAAFTTAWARQDLLRAANAVGGKKTVLYMDTDSIHTTNPDYAKYLNIDNFEIGAWKLEGIATEGVYIRQKTYAEFVQNDWIIKCAGMSKKAKKNLTIEKFKTGSIITGNLKQKRVKGGCILVETTFEIK